MLIIFTADLHLPITSRSQIRELAEEIAAKDPDVLILGGDLGETRMDINYFSECIQIFTLAFDKPILVICGNHDLWVARGPSPFAFTSQSLWDHELERQAELAGATWLENDTFTHNGIAIIGSYLHYDYSARDTIGPTAGLPLEKIEKDKKRVNNDGRFLIGLPRDRDFAKTIGKGFRRRLQEAQSDESVQEIIIATHVACVEQQMSRRPHDYGWSLGTPYFGNLSHESYIRGCNKVSHVICGHSHKGKETFVPLDSPIEGEPIRLLESRENFKAISLDSDYGEPSFAIIETST